MGGRPLSLWEAVARARAGTARRAPCALVRQFSAPLSPTTQNPSSSNHLLVAELLNIVPRIAQLKQILFRMLA